MYTVKSRQDVELTVNGERRRVPTRPNELLLETLREQLGLTGAKPGCENGDCGACTVIVDGSPMKSCLMLTVEVADADVVTVEGLQNTPIQESFMNNWAFQCGYCTSGFLMVSQALIDRHPDADDGRMTEWLRSNICRCTGYQEIQESVRDVLRES